MKQFNVLLLHFVINTVYIVNIYDINAHVNIYDIII